MYIVRHKNTQDLTMIGFPRVTESAKAMTKIPKAESSEKRELRLMVIEEQEPCVTGIKNTKITDTRTQEISRRESNEPEPGFE